MIYDFEPPNEAFIYREMIRGLIAQRSSRLIENSSTSHARIIVSELIAIAHTSIRVFCDRLSSDVWSDGSVVAAMRDAIDRGVSVSVITQSEAMPSEMLNVLQTSKAYKGNLGVRVSIPNFLVVDEVAYRIEIDEKCRQGAACANDEEVSRFLNNSFARMLDMIDQGSNVQKAS